LELPQGGRAGLALCHQITTLDRAKLSKRIGVLAPDQMEKLDEAIKTALDLD
jgi:mRNA-degrading endonuclease toxin of MazEF toxin-antitoxin module